MVEPLSNIGLPDNAICAIQDVLKRNKHVEKAILYGSCAKGNYRTGSDIDLCLECSLLTNTELWAIENQLDDLLLPWKIDLTLKHTVDNPALLEHISRVGIEFC